MHNFVHFQQKQRLVFEEGTNFIIGGNSTGKTAVFELIRRCYSNKINTTTTSVLNENELAYAVCHFKIPERFPLINFSEQPKEILACTFIKKYNKTGTKKARRGVAKKKSENDGNDCEYYKVICTISHDGLIQTFVQKFLGIYGCSTEYLEKNIIDCKQSTAKTSVIENVKNCGTKDAIDEFCKMIENDFESTVTNSYKETLTTMNALYDWIEKGYVGILPMRSIGPLQWTRSEFNKHAYRKDNYTKAYNRAEILIDLLDNDKVNKEEEDKLHRHIVHPYRFCKTDGNISVINEERRTVSSKPLLKTPEGVLEAKQLTLILAHEEYSTITFEEPDRGMHPHMIKKMRDLILKHVSGKTVLVISHNPSIIDNWAMSRTFICSKHVFGDEISHSVSKVPIEPVLNRFSRIDEMRSLLFSSRILFVEGITDKIILEAIFCLLINDDKYIRHEKQITIEQKHSLISIDIREMSGKDDYKKEEFCEKLGKEIFLLFDSDQENKSEKGNVYIWKTGAIEQRFIDVINNGDKDSVRDCSKIFHTDLGKQIPGKFDEYVNRLSKIKTIEEELTTTKQSKRQIIRLKKTNSKARIEIEKSLKEKRLFQNAKPEEIMAVARAMINYSDEVEKFIRFLTENISNENKRRHDDRK